MQQLTGSFQDCWRRVHQPINCEVWQRYNYYIHYSNPGAALVRRPTGLLCTRHRPITCHCQRMGGAITVISFVLRFVLPCDARYMPWPCACLPVCLSVTSLSSIETAEKMELGFGMHGSFLRPCRRSSLWITPTTIDASLLDASVIVYYTSVDCNSLTSSLLFVLNLLKNVFLQLCSSWQNYDWQRANRAFLLFQ